MRPWGLRGCLFACRALYLLAFHFVGDALGICHGSVNLSMCAIFRTKTLEAFQLGKLLHQLFYAVLLKLYCNLRVIPIAFATKDYPFAKLGVPDPRPLL